MAPREQGATIKTRGAPGNWRPNEVDASSQRRGGEICGRVDGGRHQQAVHAQNTWMNNLPDHPWSPPCAANRQSLPPGLLVIRDRVLPRCLCRCRHPRPRRDTRSRRRRGRRGERGRRAAALRGAARAWQLPTSRLLPLVPRGADASPLLLAGQASVRPWSRLSFLT